MTNGLLCIMRTCGIVIAAVLTSFALAHGQLERSAEVVASGGGTSSNSNLTLRSTVGQAGTTAMSGQSMQVDGGLWPALYVSEQTSTPIAGGPSDELPSDFALQPAYPNPFNPSTRIEYSLPEASQVQLSVYNALGRRVKTLVARRQPAGHHQVIFRAGDLSSGLYYYRLRAGSYHQVRAVTLVK